MKILVLLLFCSMLVYPSSASSQDFVDDYDPPGDHVIVDEGGKIRIIEDSSLYYNDRQEETHPKGRVCLSIRLDEQNNMIYDVRKCEKGS